MSEQARRIPQARMGVASRPYFSDPVALAELLEAQVRGGLNPAIQATCHRICNPF